MRSQTDYSVYLVTDSNLCQRYGFAQTVRLAAQGGAGVVQVREKNTTTRQFIELARQAKEALRGTGAKLIINDRIDIALAVGADGVHLGQSDMPCPDARRILGPKAILGLSVETVADVIEANAWDIDYYGVSPVFDTPTKTDTARAWGLAGLEQLRTQTDRLLIGIGAISANNAASVIQAGANGVAVVSAICTAADPEHATRTLAEIVHAARV